MTQIQIRRGNAAAWTAANPILAEGEMALETDTSKIKVGDGSTAWNALSYFPVEWSALNGAPEVIAAGATKADARAAIDAASLDGNGKVPVAQLPSSIMQYMGVWDADTNDPSLVDGTGNVGDVYRVTVAGSRNLGSGSIDFAVGDYVIYNSAEIWEKSDTTDAVATVAGRTGNVTLTVADIGGNTTTALGVGSIELGNASDTTVTRSASGVMAVEGVDVVTVSRSQTLTNKRVAPRIGSTASSATPSIDADAYDQYNITALAAAISGVTVTGTPTDGQKLLVRIKDNGTARAISWGSSFVASGVALPTTTAAGKTHLIGFIYDSVAAKWVCVAADSAGY